MRYSILLLLFTVSNSIAQTDAIFNGKYLIDTCTLTNAEYLTLTLNAESREIILHDVIIKPPTFSVLPGADFLGWSAWFQITARLTNQKNKTSQWYLSQSNRVKRRIMIEVKESIYTIIQDYSFKIYPYPEPEEDPIEYSQQMELYKVPFDKLKIDIFVDYYGTPEAKILNGEVFLKGEPGYENK